MGPVVQPALEWRSNLQTTAPLEKAWWQRAHASCFTMALSFALAKAGHLEGSLETTAKVTLDKHGDGFTVTRSDLTLIGNVDGIDEEKICRASKRGKGKLSDLQIAQLRHNNGSNF